MEVLYKKIDYITNCKVLYHSILKAFNRIESYSMTLGVNNRNVEYMPCRM